MASAEREALRASIVIRLGGYCSIIEVRRTSIAIEVKGPDE